MFVVALVYAGQGEIQGVNIGISTWWKRRGDGRKDSLCECSKCREKPSSHKTTHCIGIFERQFQELWMCLIYTHMFLKNIIVQSLFPVTYSND